MKLTSEQIDRPFLARLEEFCNTDDAVYVAIAYWCDERFVICSGKDRDLVDRAAEEYVSMWPCKYDNVTGDFVKGHGVEGYWIEKTVYLTHTKA